ncbi:hypothetical protein [Nocardia sp. NBC_01327]|uniref:hypothetical protein n=1 Tax=Nocardia sp. NBC_01327 TaxID=2903593 RepID=UPI002E15C206|nr:hypothetical protein OG326_23865 [Nocardia sp. NBC_01327]
MSIRMCAAAALAGAVVSVSGGAVASAAPVADGRTACGTFNRSLAQAEQTQINDAYAVRNTHQHYLDTLLPSNNYSMQDSSDANVRWAYATDAYRQSKVDTAQALAAANQADCPAGGQNS